MNSPVITRRGLLRLGVVGVVGLPFAVAVSGPAKKTTTNNQRRIFGVTYHTEIRFNKEIRSFNRGEIARDLQTIKELGVNMIRTDVCFNRVVGINPHEALKFDRWFVEEAKNKGLKFF